MCPFFWFFFGVLKSCVKPACFDFFKKRMFIPIDASIGIQKKNMEVDGYKKIQQSNFLKKHLKVFLKKDSSHSDHYFLKKKSICETCWNILILPLQEIINSK